MAKPESNEIRIVRVYDAPVKLVWEAWTDPAQVAQWWGPRGFTLTTHSKDLRVGGIWHYTMHGPDGKDWINKTLYHEVVPYAKLVYDHGGNDEQAPLFRVTATFKDLGNDRTELVMTMALPTPEAAKRHGTVWPSILVRPRTVKINSSSIVRSMLRSNWFTRCGRTPNTSRNGFHRRG